MLNFHYPSLSYFILSYPISSYLTISHLILSHPFLSYFILSYTFQSHPVLSYRTLSHPTLSHPILSHPKLSYPILTHPNPSSHPFVRQPNVPSLRWCKFESHEQACKNSNEMTKLWQEDSVFPTNEHQSYQQQENQTNLSSENQCAPTIRKNPNQNRPYFAD